MIVLRLSALGDVIHTIPAVVTLPGEVHWVVEAPYAELVEIVAGARAIPVRMKRWPRGMHESLKAIRGHDVSIDFQGLIKSAVLGALSGAKTRYGFASNAIREKPALLFTNRKVPVDTTRHVIEQNLQLAAAVSGGQAIPPVRTGKIACPPHWDAFPQGSGGEGAIVILPGAGKREKLWPVERWRALAEGLGANTIIAWGPNELELAKQIGAPLAPPTNLRQLAALLRNARLVIGADTGPLHLAAALGTKVIGLYGPTDPRRNGPYGQLEHCVNEFDRTKCMESIAVEEVMNMVERVCA